MQVLERDIEQRFLIKIKREVPCAVPIKLNLMGNTGWPDRMVILPEGRVAFIEFKRPGEEVRVLQRARHKKLKELGHAVGTFDNAEEAITFIKAVVG